MPVKTIEEAKILTEGWARDRGFLSEKPKPDNEDAIKQFNFKYDGETQTGVNFSLIQPKDLNRAVVAISRIEIAPIHLKLLDSLASDELDNFLWDVRKELAFAPASFMFLPLDGKLESIQFTKEISFDELTEGRLSDAVDSLIRCTLVVVWLFRKAFGTGKED